MPPECPRVQCRIVKGLEGGRGEGDADRMNLSTKPGTQSCLYMSQCLVPLSTAEAQERVKGSCPLLTDTIQQILRLTRPFSFCK